MSKYTFDHITTTPFQRALLHSHALSSLHTQLSYLKVLSTSLSFYFFLSLSLSLSLYFFLSFSPTFCPNTLQRQNRAASKLPKSFIRLSLCSMYVFQTRLHTYTNNFLFLSFWLFALNLFTFFLSLSVLLFVFSLFHFHSYSVSLILYLPIFLFLFTIRTHCITFISFHTANSIFELRFL